jgi:hypothetical protein
MAYSNDQFGSIVRSTIGLIPSEGEAQTVLKAKPRRLTRLRRGGFGTPLSADDPLSGVVDFLRDIRVLTVLDNWGRVIAGCLPTLALWGVIGTTELRCCNGWWRLWR